jgi:hypothetical protein
LYYLFFFNLCINSNIYGFQICKMWLWK